MKPATFKRIHKALGLTEKGLAAELGVASSRAVRHWKAGTRPITGPVSVAMRYFWFFGLASKALPEDEDDLVGDHKRPKP